MSDEIAQILADGRPAIRCGCGFLVVSDDPEANLSALDAHDCPATYSEAAEKGDHWYHHAFSWYGMLIVFIIAVALVDILGHHQ